MEEDFPAWVTDEQKTLVSLGYQLWAAHGRKKANIQIWIGNLQPNQASPCLQAFFSGQIQPRQMGIGQEQGGNFDPYVS